MGTHQDDRTNPPTPGDQAMERAKLAEAEMRLSQALRPRSVVLTPGDHALERAKLVEAEMRQAQALRGLPPVLTPGDQALERAKFVEAETRLSQAVRARPALLTPGDQALERAKFAEAEMRLTMLRLESRQATTVSKNQNLRPRARKATKKTPWATTNELMQRKLESNPASSSWTAAQWAESIGRAPSTIVDTPTWKDLAGARATEGALREIRQGRKALDRRRKPRKRSNE
jgi:hypothetical protein